MSVFAKLQEAKVRLQQKSLKKSGHNKFAGYDYFELGDFLPAIVDIFADLKLWSGVSFTAEKATLTVVDLEKNPGEVGGSVDFHSPMAEAQLKGCHPIQNLGAAQTYLRRYLYVAALDIVEHDALDAAEPLKPETKPGVGVHKPTDGAGDSLAIDQIDAMRSFAEEITDGFREFGAAEAFSRYDLMDITQDEKIYLWSLLDSKVRSAIKKVAASKQL